MNLVNTREISERAGVASRQAMAEEDGLAWDCVSINFGIASDWGVDSMTLAQAVRLRQICFTVVAQGEGSGGPSEPFERWCGEEWGISTRDIKTIIKCPPGPHLTSFQGGRMIKSKEILQWNEQKASVLKFYRQLAEDEREMFER